MQTRYLAYPIIIVFLAIMILVKCATDKMGLAAIKASIDKQLSNAVLHSTNLNGLKLGRKGRVHFIGSASPFKGDIQYQAELNGSSVILVVFWVGDSNLCQITKIESHSANLGTQTLWQDSY